MSRPAIAALLTTLTLLNACRSSPAPHPPAAPIVLERTPSNEVSMLATLGFDPNAGPTLNITLRNVSQRTLVFDTGYGGVPMANFAFNFERPDHVWLQLYCRTCMPGSFSQNTPYTIQLSPWQFLRYTVPLSTFVAAAPITGTSIDIGNLHGRMLIELQVPTPPIAEHKDWPGYVTASVTLP